MRIDNMRFHQGTVSRGYVSGDWASLIASYYNNRKSGTFEKDLDINYYRSIF